MASTDEQESRPRRGGRGTSVKRKGPNKKASKEENGEGGPDGGGGGGNKEEGTTTKKTRSMKQVAQQMARPKLDMRKALAIMGFNSAKKLQAVSEDGKGKEELQEALAKQMEALERKKTRAVSSMATSKYPVDLAAMEDKHRNEIMMLHESYQFLSLKYSGGRAEDEEDDDEEVGGGGGAWEQPKSWRD